MGCDYCTREAMGQDKEGRPTCGEPSSCPPIVSSLEVGFSSRPQMRMSGRARVTVSVMGGRGVYVPWTGDDPW